MNKLTIDRETIRNLSSEDLKGVVGGVSDTTYTPGSPMTSAATAEAAETTNVN